MVGTSKNVCDKYPLYTVDIFWETKIGRFLTAPFAKNTKNAPGKYQKSVIPHLSLDYRSHEYLRLLN